MALIFVSNHLYLFVVALLTIFFTYFSFQIKNFLWEHVKPLVQILRVGSTVMDLTREFDILEMKLKDVQEVIKMDEASMKKPTAEVEGWMKRVEALQPSVESIITDYANQRYLRSICSIGLQAVNKLKEVRQEAESIKSVRAYTMSVLMPATPIEFGREEFESRLEKALNFLRDDSQGVLGIWGMGGVGKTTLLEHINNTLAEDPSSFGFHVVVLVKATRECTPEKIREELVEKMGLSRGESPDIFKYLKNKSFAILLDNLWGDVDLKKVGIPLPLGKDGVYKRKLILTSRLESVCNNNMGAPEPAAQIKVDCLGQEDAGLLFRRIVGEEIISSNLTIENLAQEVADLCGGLPTALNAVGRAMAGTTDDEVWKNAVDQLRKSRSKFFETREGIAGTEGNPLPLLKLSYDHLKDHEKKECFLHCALWPEDFEIDVDELIRCWIGHGLLGEFDNLNEAYGKGHTVIDSLQKACLLEKVALAYYEFGSMNQRVKLHHLIRDMALWIACDCGANMNKWVVLPRQDLQEAPRDQRLWGEAHKISLVFNQIKSLPSEIQNSPNLTTLMLQSNHFSDEGLATSRYFNSLKYLDISRSLELKCFPTDINKLTNLEYLNISKTGISSLPQEPRALENIKHLIAQGVSIRSRVTRELLSNLATLIELDLFESGNQRLATSVIDNLDCLEGRLKGLGISVTTVSNLQKLVQLSRIPIISLCLKTMAGLDISLKLLSHDFLGSPHIQSHLKKLTLYRCGSVKEVVVEGRHQLNIKRLHLNLATRLKEVIWRGVEPMHVLPKLRQVKISRCYVLKSIEWVMYLPCLELLDLDHCNKMKQMFGEEAGAAGRNQEAEDTPTFPTFPSLRTLALSDLQNLNSICHRQLTFPSLELLYIYNCRQLRSLPFHSRSSCTKLREILCDEATKNGIDLEENMRPILEPLFKII